MTWRPIRLLFCAAQAAAFVAASPRGALAAPPGAASERVVISLRASSVTGSNDVLISDIARVDTTNAALKTWIESLDLVDGPRPGESTVISPKLVEFRLRVAGVDPLRVTVRGRHAEVTGSVDSTHAVAERLSSSIERKSGIRTTAYATTTAATVDAPAERPGALPPGTGQNPKSVAEELRQGKSIEDVIVDAARKAILDQLPWNEEDLSFRLVQSISREAKLVDTSGDCTCTALLRASGPAVGRVNVDVTVVSGQQAPIEIPVSFDVRHFDTVVSTARPIPRGRKIQMDDLYLHRWDVTGAQDYCTQPDKLVGRVAGRTLSAVQIVREQDLERGSANLSGSDQPVLIKRAARVKLTAKIGDLNITVAGEALQDGRVGEIIRVQNVESKSVVQGRVLSADEVEITY